MANQFKRNESLWQNWTKYGVNASTELSTDFTFYCASQNSAERLKGELEKENYVVKIKETKTFFIFRGYEVMISIKDKNWSLERLNNLSIKFIELAKKCNCDFETIGAFIP